MTETKTSRSARLADQFEAAQESFIRLVESLSDEQWRMTGAEFPELQRTMRQRRGRCVTPTTPCGDSD